MFDITEGRQINTRMCTIATKWLSEMVVEKQSIQFLSHMHTLLQLNYLVL